MPKTPPPRPAGLEEQPTRQTPAVADPTAATWRSPSLATQARSPWLAWLTRQGALKVPQIIALFWVVKLLTTALGESTSDFLVFSPIGPYVAVGLGFVGLVVALILQLSAKRYIAWVYWLAVTMVAIFGTMAADVLHVGFGVPYWVSCVFFGACVAIALTLWYRVERTLSIHSVFTMRRELFYWATVMATFALGTAAGDLTASTFRLGYFPSVILFAILIALPALGFWFLGLNEIAAFWAAYIVTRPLGASIADWLGKPKFVTGLGLGDGPVSIVLTLLAIIAVAYLTLTHADVQRTPRSWLRQDHTHGR
jgi:uncharacterized membrane-anchored protein